MKKRTIRGKYIIISIAFLCLAVAVSAYINASASEKMQSGYSLTITRNGEEQKTFTLDQLKEMESVTVEKKIESASFADEDGSYTGVPLSDILKSVDKTLLSECDTYITQAGDSFSSALSAEDILKENNVLVIYEKDGKALKPFTEGGTGPLRLLIQADDYGNRSTKYLVRIECR